MYDMWADKDIKQASMLSTRTSKHASKRARKHPKHANLSSTQAQKAREHARHAIRQTQESGSSSFSFPNLLKTFIFINPA